MDPITDARALVRKGYPDALTAFLGAGILSARRTATSDLDIVVLIGGPPAPYRESLTWRGWPAEVFVQDVASIRAWFAKDAVRRRPTLARMCADGEILTDPGETAVICWNVFVQVAELALLLDGRWLGGGKWLLRELRASEPALAEAMIAARESPGTLTTVADSVLARAGGRLWAGFRQAGRA